MGSLAANSRAGQGRAGNGAGSESLEVQHNGRVEPEVLRVRIQVGEDGYYVVQGKEYPAAVSQGKTRDEALRNIVEALELVRECRGETNSFIVCPEEG